MGRVASSRSGRHRLLIVLILLVTAIPLVRPAPAQAALTRGAFEQCLLDKTNQARAAEGVGPLQMARDRVSGVRDWSEWIRFNEFKHMLSSVRQDILPNSWTTWGENIAMHSFRNMPDCNPIHELWMDSPGHRAAIVNPDYRFVAIGTYVDSSGWWATQLFFNATNYQPTCDGTFCDDDGNTFEVDIEKIAADGITRGCNPPENELFCPHDRVTRGEMAAFLTRAFNLSASGGVDFTDDNGSTFEADIEKLAAAGITQGCNPPSNTRFCPGDHVTRGQFAAFLARALDLPAASGIDFADANGSTFEDDIQRIAAAGITQGCNPPSNTRFCPGDHVTRGQMAAFLARALGL